MDADLAKSIGKSIDGCIARDKPAWDAFVQRWSGVIYAAVRRALQTRSVNQGDIDDRVQDVFVRLIQNDYRLLKTYDAQRASLSTWLTLVARSVVHENLQRRRLATVPLEASDGFVDHDPATVNGESLPLKALTERQRLVMEMLFQQGLTVEQAAQRLGVDPQTVRSTKHKALSRLRQDLPDLQP